VRGGSEEHTPLPLSVELEAELEAEPLAPLIVIPEYV